MYVAVEKTDQWHASGGSQNESQPGRRESSPQDPGAKGTSTRPYCDSILLRYLPSGCFERAKLYCLSWNMQSKSCLGLDLRPSNKGSLAEQLTPMLGCYCHERDIDIRNATTHQSTRSQSTESNITPCQTVRLFGPQCFRCTATRGGPTVAVRVKRTSHLKMLNRR